MATDDEIVLDNEDLIEAPEGVPLWVSNLPYDSSRRDIWNHVSTAGRVISVDLLTDE